MAARQNIYFVVHTKSSPGSLVPAVRQGLASLDRELPVAALRPMSDYVLEARTQSRFVAVLFASLAGIALLLASIGIYAVTANSVGRRTREIGIRMAFGAKPSDIIKLVSTIGFRPAVLGAVVGLSLSFLLTPLLSNLLFGVRPISAIKLASVFVFVSSLSLFAILIPTASVLRRNPMSAGEPPRLLIGNLATSPVDPVRPNRAVGWRKVRAPPIRKPILCSFHQ